MALSASSRIPIADLNPGISVSDSVVHGIVTLVWPYSSVNQTYSFLLVEPDFRLRRQRGQVRISLRDSCARRVTRAGLVSGDEIYLAVDGAQWQKDKTTASTPGRGIEWELLYMDHIRFEKVSENGENFIVDTSRMSSSPDLLPSSLPSSVPPPDILSSIQTQSTPRMVPQAREALNAWSSPVFIKEKRLPDIFPLSSDLEAFHEEEEEWSSGPPAKKLKFGRKSDQWRFVRRSASPETDSELQKASQSVERPRTPDLVSPVAEQSVPEAPAAILDSDTSIHSIVTKPRTEASSVEIDQESVPIQSALEAQAAPISDDIVSQSLPLQLVDQEPDGSLTQSFIQNIPITTVAESSSDSYPILDTFSQPPIETAASSIIIVPEDDKDVVEMSHHQKGYIPTIQDESLNIPRSPSPVVSLSSVPRRAISRTPEPHLEINIQSSTPLVQPISLDPIPITPRLQPLPSPGLDLVSPIDQRHPARAGEYFTHSEEAESRLISSSQVSGTDAPVIQHVQALETYTTDFNGPNQPESEKQPKDKLQTAEDTFFNRLLARYDEGTDQNPESVIGQPVSSSIPPEDPLEEYHADAQRTPIPFAIDNAMLVDQSLEVIVTDNASQDLTSDLEETQVNEIVEIFENEIESQESVEAESEDSSDDNNTITGKWRDATYKPSQETAIELGKSASSPLLTQYPEPLHPDSSPNTQKGSVKASSHHMDILTVPQTHRAIQDTYFPEDSHRDRAPSIETEDMNDIEVVDLLDSDSSSSVSAAPEDKLSPELGNEENITEVEVLEDGYTTPSIVTSSSPIITTNKPNQGELPDISPVDHDDYDKQPIETQHQEFYTAPAGFDGTVDGNTMGLTQITNDDVESQNIDLLEHQDPAITIQETPEKQVSSVTELAPQDLTRTTRASQRITRSQSHQTAEAATLEDETPSEEVEHLLATKHSQVNSADYSSQGFRTANDYYSPLTTLSDFHNNLTSLLAVVVASSKPIRSTAGPRDFTQSIYLAAPKSQVNNDFTIAQLFRPFSSALPYPLPTGSVILLKNFKVQSYKRKMSLLSTSTSAWAVFDQVSATNQSEMKVSIAGPPVDFGGAERGIAWGLGKWWTSLDHDIQNKITSAASIAKNQAEAELEKKTASARKTRDTKASQSQLHLQTPSRRQTRSSQSQDQVSIPNTPSTHVTTPSPPNRRTRSSQQASTPTPTKTRHSLRSGLVYSDNEVNQVSRAKESYELDENAETNEFDQAELLAANQSQKTSTRTAPAGDNGSSQGNVKTRAQSKKEATKGTGKKAGEKALWHELRDGAVYKD